MEIKKDVDIDSIIIDGGTQFRAKINDQRVQEYADMLADDGWPFDSACDVFYDGASYYLVDGFHRYLAAKRVGRDSISCQVHNGSLRDAIKFALSANSRHGLYRSNEDKRKAVEFALADEEWSKLSSRALAELCGVSDMFVGSIRKESGASRLHPDGKVVGKDGKPQSATKKPSSKSNPKPATVAAQPLPSEPIDVLFDSPEDDNPIASPADAGVEYEDDTEDTEPEKSTVSPGGGLVAPLPEPQGHPAAEVKLSKKLCPLCGFNLPVDRVAKLCVNKRVPQTDKERRDDYRDTALKNLEHAMFRVSELWGEISRKQPSRTDTIQGYREIEEEIAVLMTRLEKLPC